MTGSKSPFDGRRPARRAALAVLAGALVAMLLSLAIGGVSRQALFDLYQRGHPRSVGADKVAVVLVDPESLATVGGWPWPRYYLARLTEQVAAQQPAIIGFDMIFPEADRLNPDHFASLYPELDAGQRAAIASLPTMDALFAQTIGASPVLLGRLALDGDGRDPADLLADPPIAGRAPKGLPSGRQVLASIPEIDDVALAHAMLNGPPDADGVVRRVPVAVRTGERVFPGLAVELARHASRAEGLRFTDVGLALGPRTIPIDAEGRMRLWFGRFPPQATYGAARVLAGDVPPDAFAGKVVLVGLGAEGAADVVATPVQTEGYGVFVQAQAVDSILSGQWLDRPRWAVVGEWAVGGLLVLLVIAAAVHRRRWLFAVAAGVILLPLLSWLAFTEARLLLDPLRPAMLAAGGALALQSVNLARIRQERARLAAELVEQRVSSARQEGELEAARAIQLGMVPSKERLAGLDARVDVAGTLDPARSVGGDFYDAAMLDADRMLLVIGDVTGKGVPAALYMALSKGLAKSMLMRAAGGLGEAMADLNRELLRDADETMGVTMLIAVLDCRTGSLEMVCAGHENPILRGADAAARTLPLRGGPPLCVVDFPYQSERAELGLGEMLVLITDGVTEAQDADGTLFEVAGALAAIGGVRSDDAAAMAGDLRDAVRAFEGDTDPSDDLTILVARRTA